MCLLYIINLKKRGKSRGGMMASLLKRCSYCSTPMRMSDVVSITCFSADGDKIILAYSFCSFDHLDKWLWRMGYRFYRDINHERKKNLHNGSKRVVGESTGHELAHDNASNGGVLQQGSTQAEPTA